MQEWVWGDILTLLLPPPPPSCARASLRWRFNTTLASSLACKSELELTFQCHSHLLHLPWVQEWAVVDISTPLSPLPPPSCARASWRWHLAPLSPPPPSLRARASWRECFNTTLTFSTSLACKSELVVTFRHYSHLLHLPRVQESWRWHFHFNLFLASSTSIMCAIASQSWCFGAVLTSLACKSEPWGLWHFDAICTSLFATPPCPLPTRTSQQ